tara:strand:+ start:109 stop:528 length:420 start_codon:yes stop_codon:yes gene_type:complete
MKIVYTQTAEILVPGGSTISRYYFNNLPNLRCVKTTALTSYDVANIPIAPSQNPLVNAAVSNVAFLTLVTEDNVEIIKEIPYLELTSTSAISNAVPVNQYFHEIEDAVIVWEKSYITLGSIAGIAAGDEVFLFNIYYKD